MNIEKKELEHDMYFLKLSRNQIAKKYQTNCNYIKKLQYKFNLEILNINGEKVPNSLNFEQKQLFYGLSISNSDIIKKDQYSHALLRIKSNIKNDYFVDFLYENLKEFTRTKPTIQISNFKGKACKCKSFKTLKHNFFTYLYYSLYKDGNKTINNNILDKIEPLGLSIIYMDSGKVRNKCRDFLLHGYSYEDNVKFCNWIEDKYDIKARVISNKECKIRVYSWEKFDELVKPFIIDKMKYKIQKN